MEIKFLKKLKDAKREREIEIIRKKREEWKNEMEKGPFSYDELDFKAYYGQNYEALPRIKQYGRVPISTADYMKKCVEFSSTPLEKAWLGNMYGYGMGDVIFYHPNGNAKIVFDSLELRELNKDTDRIKGCGAFFLPDGIYEKLDGAEFAKRELNKYAKDIPLAKEQAKTNPFWETLSRDLGLLEEFVDVAFCKYKKSMQIGVESFHFHKNYRDRVSGVEWHIGNISPSYPSHAWGKYLGGLAIFIALEPKKLEEMRISA